MLIRVLRLLLQFALNEGWIDKNPAEKPGLVATAPRDKIWSREAIEAMVAACDRRGVYSVGTAVLLGAFLGQRQGDILKLTWDSYKDGSFILRQGKTKRWVEVPAHPQLAERLESIAKTAATIVTYESTGKAFRSDTFAHVFKDIKEEAVKDCEELEELWFMDLRRTAVVRLAEAGATEAEIAAVTGHQIESCRQILETYLPRTGEMASRAIGKLTLKQDLMNTAQNAKVGIPTPKKLEE